MNSTILEKIQKLDKCLNKHRYYKFSFDKPVYKLLSQIISDIKCSTEDKQVIKTEMKDCLSHLSKPNVRYLQFAIGDLYGTYLGLSNELEQLAAQRCAKECVDNVVLIANSLPYDENTLGNIMSDMLDAWDNILTEFDKEKDPQKELLIRELNGLNKIFREAKTTENVDRKQIKDNYMFYKKAMGFVNQYDCYSLMWFRQLISRAVKHFYYTQDVGVDVEVYTGSLMVLNNCILMELTEKTKRNKRKISW